MSFGGVLSSATTVWSLRRCVFATGGNKNLHPL